MAYRKLNTNLPQVYVPSLSLPKPSAPKPYHVLPSTPFKMGYTPAERRHVRDLGDIVLGNPITGTRQLRETLEDNNASYLIGSPIISRLAGLQYLIKEDLVDPFKDHDIPIAAGVAFINSVETLGYSLDTLANPVKSLMPWAGGGKDGDFLRSMGWIDDEYREQYQWDTGIFAVDLAGEILSDPLNIAKIGSKVVLNASGLYDDLAIKIRDVVRNRWGDVVADDLPDSFIKQVIDELEKDVAKVDESKIIEKLRLWARREKDLNIVTASSASDTANAIRYMAEHVEPYKRVLDLKQQDKFLEDLLDIKLSKAYRQYNAIRGVGETAQSLDNQLLSISLGINPLLGGNAFLFKKLSPIAKAKWKNLLDTKKDFDLDSYFDNTPAAVKRLQRVVTMKSKTKYKNIFSKFKSMLQRGVINIDELIEQYYRILDNTPLALRTKRGVDYAFVKWLRKRYPELQYAIDLINDSSLRELLDSIKIGPSGDIPPDSLTILYEYFGDLVEIEKEETVKNVVKAKQVKVVVDAISDIAIQQEAITEAAKIKLKEALLKEINDFFSKKNKRPLPVREYINRLEKEIRRYERKIRIELDIDHYSKLRKYKKQLNKKIDAIIEKEIKKQIPEIKKGYKNKYKEIYIQNKLEPFHLFRNDVYSWVPDDVHDEIIQKITDMVLKEANEYFKSPDVEAMLEKYSDEWIEKWIKEYTEKRKQELLKEYLSEIEQKITDSQRKMRKQLHDFKINKELEIETLKQEHPDLNEPLAITERNSLDDYKIIDLLDFIDQHILTVNSTYYGFNRLDWYFKYANSLTLDELNRVFNALGINVTLDNLNHPLINEYIQYIKSGRTNKAILKDMQKYLLRNAADDGSSLGTDSLKKINIVRDTGSDEKMKAYVTAKVTEIEDDLEEIAFNIKLEIIPNILFRSQGMNYEDALGMFETIDSLFPYYGGSVLDADEKTWAGSFKKLMNTSATTIIKDPRTFYDRLENFKRNVDRMYWRLHNSPLESDIHRKVIEVQPNFISIIDDLHNNLETAQDKLMPRLIELANGRDDIYKLQLTHKANVSRLRLALYQLFETNPEVWNEYINPNSATRKNLERICAMYAAKDDEAAQFASEILTVFTYLDATTAMNNLFDAIPNLTKYKMPTLYNNILIDRILDVIEKYSKSKIKLESLDPEKIATEIMSNVKNVLKYSEYTYSEGRLYDQVVEEFFKLNPEYVDDFFYSINRKAPMTQLSMDDYDKVYNNFKFQELEPQVKTNLRNALAQYIGDIIKLQKKNSFVTLGIIIDSQAIEYMNTLGAFQADIIGALENLDFAKDDVQLVKDFISNVTGRYLHTEIDAAKAEAEKRLEDLKAILSPEEYRAQIIKATVEALDSQRTIENTLGRTVTEVWNNIARDNDELQVLLNKGGKVKTKYGVKRMKNILGYITRSEIDAILSQEQTAYNIMSWAVANGEVGLKKVIDKNRLRLYNLNPYNFKFISGEDDSLFLQLYKNYEYYYLEVSHNRLWDIPKEAKEEIRANLIKFASENNTVTKWLPNNPELYFNNLDTTNLVAWDQLIRSGMMENKTAQGYSLANKYKAIKLTDKTAEDVAVITENLSVKQALKRGIDVTSEEWKQAVDTVGEMHLTGLEDVFLTDIHKYMKDLDSMQYHKWDFENFIYRQQKAYNNLKPIIDISEDTREIGEVIDYKRFSKFEQSQLQKYGINKHTRINSKEFQKFLSDETARNISMSIRTATAKELRGFLDDYTEGLMFFVSDGRPFKWTKAQLAEAGVVIVRVPESDIWVIRRTDNISRGYKFKWKMGKSYFPEIRQQYTDVIAKNRNYFNLQGMDVPNEFITGDMASTHEYRAILKDEELQKLIGDSTEQKVYSKLSKNGRNNFYYGDYSRINLVFIGDTSNAYNTILDHFTGTLVSEGITPYFKSNRLDTLMYWGNTTAIKNVNKKTKFLQLFFNDDFSLGNPLFKQGFENATDEELKTFFDRNNFVACLLKEDRHGNPKVYRIYVENKKQLQDAIKAKAIVVPYETYSTMISVINSSLLEDKIFQAYSKYIVGSFKTIYLTVLGFLMRNGLDSLVHKNINSADGIPGILDTFRYEFEARKMLKEYNDIIKEALSRGGNTFKREALNEVLAELPRNKQLEFRLTNRFINSKASSSLAEAMEQYYRSKELREGIVTGNKSFWARFNEDVIHGKYSPITLINDTNSNIEQTARYGLFLNLVHNGVDVQDALKKVIDTHFNYDLKGTNLEILEQLFWFSTFPINNFNYYINEGLTKNPEILKAQIAALELSYNNGDITWEDVKNSNYLRYNASVGNIILQFNGKNIVLKSGSSVLDFFNILFNPIGQAGERLNPFLAVLLGIEDVSELNPFSATYNRTKQFIQGNSLIPSVYSPLYERPQYSRLPIVPKEPVNYKKSRWRPKYRKSYFKNPDNMKRMMYKFTTYRYYFGRGKNYRRWLQSSTSIEPYWYNQNYKTLRSSRARRYKQQIKRI